MKNNKPLNNLTKEELVELVQKTELKFADSNANAAELIIQLEETHEKLKTTFDELLQASKLSSLGKIISDVCHEISNPLAIITGYLNVLKNSDHMSPDEKTMLTRCQFGAKRVTRIVDHLRYYVRKSPDGHTEMADIRLVLNEMVSFFSPQLKYHDIALGFKSEDSIHTMINPTNFESIFQNLIVNSRDAFLDHPEIMNKKTRSNR